MHYVTEHKIIKMNGDNTPGAGMGSDYSSYYMNHETDLNGACVPYSKEDGANLKKIEQDIQNRFCLEEQGVG